MSADRQLGRQLDPAWNWKNRSVFIFIVIGMNSRRPGFIIAWYPIWLLILLGHHVHGKRTNFGFNWEIKFLPRLCMSHVDAVHGLLVFEVLLGGHITVDVYQCGLVALWCGEPRSIFADAPPTWSQGFQRWRPVLTLFQILKMPKRIIANPSQRWVFTWSNIYCGHLEVTLGWRYFPGII